MTELMKPIEEDVEIDWDLFEELYHDDPNAFMEDILGFKPDPWQEKATKGFQTHQKTTIPAGQGVGKTGWVACIIIWFITFHYMCRIVATAPTKQQLNTVLWPEINKWLRGSILEDVIIWKKTQIEMAGFEANWFGVSKTASRPENMQGFHEDNMLFVVDESSGVADDIIETIYGTLSGDNNKMIMIGNMNKKHGAFYDSTTKDRGMFYVQRVSSRDSSRTSKETIQMLENKYGADSNVVRVRVDGLPPKNEDDVMIPIELMEAAMHSDAPVPIPGEVDLIDIGCDVARFGADKTIFAVRVDDEIQKLMKYQKASTMDTAENLVFLGNTLRYKYKYKGIVVFKIDDTGVGGGVTDRLMQKQKNDPDRYGWFKVVPVQFGKKTNQFRYYDDTTSYMMGVLKELVSKYDTDGNKKDCILRLPNDDDLIGQASSRKYFMTDSSKIRVESKKDMKKRGVSSPDELDAVLLAVLPVKRKK